MTTEIIFWCIAALMLAAAIAFLAAAFWRTPLFSSTTGTSEEANRGLLVAELELLEREHKAGLVSQAIYEESVEDVRRRALEELGAAPKGRRLETHQKAVFAALSGFVAAVSLAVYSAVGAPGMIPFVDSQSTQRLMRADGTLAAAAPQYDEELMRAYLKRNPGDERAWVLLARLLVKQSDWKGAVEAYKSALDLGRKVSRDVEVWTEYAASVMSLPEQDAYETGLPIVQKALELDEANAQAHELAAIACLETRRWGQARVHLEYLLSRLTMDSPRYRRLAGAAALAARMERMQNEEQEKGAADARP